MLINCAQARKWNGSDERCNEILKGGDWSAWEDKFRLAVAALSGDHGRRYDLVRKPQHDRDFHKVNYREWPVFRELRK